MACLTCAVSCVRVCVCVCVCVPTGGRARTRDLAPTGYLQIAAFCVFELCLGIFWPAMMTLRAQLVPEEMRSTIINCFRIPLNLFVCVALFKVSACVFYMALVHA